MNDLKLRLDLNDGDYLKIMTSGKHARVILKSGDNKLIKDTLTANIEQIRDPLSLHAYVDAVFSNKSAYPVVVTENNKVKGIKVDGNNVNGIKEIRVDNIKNSLYDLTIIFKELEHE